MVLIHYQRECPKYYLYLQIYNLDAAFMHYIREENTNNELYIHFDLVIIHSILIIILLILTFLGIHDKGELLSIV